MIGRGDRESVFVIAAPLAERSGRAFMFLNGKGIVRTMSTAIRLLLALPLLAIAACAASPEQKTAQLLDRRLEAQLAPDIAAHRAVVERTQDGARVTLLDPLAFPADPDVLTERGADVRAGIVEGLLDPDLMRVRVTDTSNLPADRQDDRVRNVARYFIAYGVGPVLRPAEPAQAGAPGPAGLAIDISVVCPHRNDGSGYGSGARKPDCF